MFFCLSLKSFKTLGYHHTKNHSIYFFLLWDCNIHKHNIGIMMCFVAQLVALLPFRKKALG